MQVFCSAVLAVAGVSLTEIRLTGKEEGGFSIEAPSARSLAVLDCGHFACAPVCPVCGKPSGAARYYPGVNAKIARRTE